MCFKKDKQTQLPQDLDYIKTCFSENLRHARHVENERLSFTSIYIALVVGAVAVVFGLDNNWIAFSVAAVLTVLGAMAMLLNMRWQEVFSRHMEKAKACEKAWRAQVGEGDCRYFDSETTDPHKGYTEWIFALLYFGIFVSLLVLSIHLHQIAQESSTGGGFYFSTDAIEKLEEAIRRIVEASKQ